MCCVRVWVPAVGNYDVDPLASTRMGREVVPAGIRSRALSDDLSFEGGSRPAGLPLLNISSKHRTRVSFGHRLDVREQSAFPTSFHKQSNPKAWDDRGIPDRGHISEYRTGCYCENGCHQTHGDVVSGTVGKHHACDMQNEHPNPSRKVCRKESARSLLVVRSHVHDDPLHAMGGHYASRAQLGRDLSLCS